jgi:hypothetical protein
MSDLDEIKEVLDAAKDKGNKWAHGGHPVAEALTALRDEFQALDDTVVPERDAFVKWLETKEESCGAPSATGTPSANGIRL